MVPGMLYNHRSATDEIKMGESERVSKRFLWLWAAAVCLGLLSFFYLVYLLVMGHFHRDEANFLHIVTVGICYVVCELAFYAWKVTTRLAQRIEQLEQRLGDSGRLIGIEKGS
jgi:hypothetical protein